MKIKKINKIESTIVVISIAMGLYHISYIFYTMVGGTEHKFIHLAFALSLVFLTTIQETEKHWKQLILVLIILLSIGSIGYLWYNLERLSWDAGFPSPNDIIVSILIIGIVFWACRLTYGYILPAVAVCLFIYAFFCRYFGGPFLSLREIISATCLTFYGYDMFGAVLGVSANVIFLFIFYSGLLQCLKATDFFVEIGKFLGKYTKSGPAMTAVVSSSLMGMTAGQATPNIAVTGAFTIPLMKKAGYKPAVAGSIEAAASGGGQIMPPIMGAGAFVMADLLGVSYATIILMAVIPAILYFVSVGTYVHLNAIKENVKQIEEEVDMKRLYATAPMFILPLGVMLTFLFMRYPPMFAAFCGIATMVITAYIRKETRPSLRVITEGCVRGAKTGSQIAVACATLGPIIALMTKSGLGLLIGFSVEKWCGGNLFLGLVILAVAVIVLGLEVPTVAAYLIAAIIAIPALVKLGLDSYQAHMFAFYFGSFSGLTPPVGLAAIVASKLANAPYLKTAFLSIGAASAAYIVPFIFVYNGALLLMPGINMIWIIISIIGTAIGLLFFQAGIIGQLRTHLNPLGRLLAITVAIGLFCFVALKNMMFLLLLLALFPLFIMQLKKNT
jgi:TRAP transporter 4TM/12TM fusion protein